MYMYMYMYMYNIMYLLGFESLVSLICLFHTFVAKIETDSLKGKLAGKRSKRIVHVNIQCNN